LRGGLDREVRARSFERRGTGCAERTEGGSKGTDRMSVTEEESHRRQ